MTCLCGSERALLNHLLNKLHQLDPDVLVGHNISGFDLDVLLHRLQVSFLFKLWTYIMCYEQMTLTLQKYFRHAKSRAISGQK